MAQSLSEQFFNGFANAVDDVRTKSEEVFFGRAVTEKGPDPRWPEAREVEPAQEREAPEPEIDRDR